jgi:hypothetical protein
LGRELSSFQKMKFQFLSQLKLIMIECLKYNSCFSPLTWQAKCKWYHKENIFPQDLKMSSSKLKACFWVSGIGVLQSWLEDQVLTTHLRKRSYWNVCNNNFHNYLIGQSSLV